MKRKTSALGTKRTPAGVGGPGDDIARGVNALLKMRVEEGCERAWSELADLFGVATLFPKNDPASAAAKSGVHTMIDELTRELTKLTVAALLLPPPKTERPLRLLALRSGANGNGHAGRTS